MPDPMFSDPMSPDLEEPAALKVDRMYTLRVLGATKLLSTSYGNLPNAFVEIRLEHLSMRTDTVKRSEAPCWNEEFQLISKNDYPQLIMRVMHRTLNPFLPDSCLGIVDENIPYLINKCSGSESENGFTFALRNPKDRWSGEKRGSIKIFIMEQSAIATASGAITLARNVMESAGITGPADSALVVGDASDMIDSAVNLAIVMSKLAALGDIVDTLSRVHPYVAIAWQVTSSLYKVMVDQLDRDLAIAELLAAMENVYSFVDVLQTFPEKIKILEDTITKILTQTVECAIFIREYSGNGFAGRIWRQTFSNTKETINQMTKTLLELKASFDSGLAVQIAFLSMRTSETVESMYERQYLDRLKPATMDASARVGCLPSTRQEILQFVTDWVTSPSSSQNILWLYGMAGSGKSALATSISSYFHDLGRLAAFLFFDRDITERSEPTSVIRTLAHQLGVYDRRFLRAISSGAGRFSWQWPLLTQVRKLLIEPLSSVEHVGIEGPVVIVFDALDECGTAKTRKPLLDLLVEEFLKLPPNFRIVITSRAERDIQASFAQRPNIISRELDITTTSSMNDIMSYLRHWMGVIRTSNPLLQLPSDWPGESRILDLAKRSSGLFVWASTAIVFIGDGHDPDECLNALLSSDSRAKGESALDELYMTALRSTGKWKDETFVSDFHNIMGTILVARDPLSPSAVDNLIKLARPSLHTISYLGCVVHWSPNQPIRILHPSFGDFLTNRARCGDDWYIEPAYHDRQLAHHCLKHLGVELHENVLGLKLDCRQRPEPSCLAEDVVYASTFWVDHTCTVDDETSALVVESDKFLDLHLLHWFETMSIAGRVGATTNLLARLRAWLQAQGTDNIPLLEFVDDARRFAQAFTSVMQQHPMAVYQTALPFTPKHTLLYKHFHDGESFPVVLGSFRSFWPPQDLTVFQGPSRGINSITFSPDGLRIASGSDDTTICIWDVVSHTEIFPPLLGHEGPVESVAYAPDGRKLVSGALDTTIRVWDAISGKSLNILRGHEGGVEAVAFSPDGTRVVSGSTDMTIQMWDVESGISILTLNGHTDTVYSVAFTPCARKVVSGSEDKTVRIWELDSRNHTVLQGHSGSVLSVAMSSDGTRIASCSQDCTAIIWDASAGTLIRRLYHDDAPVISITFSPDGAFILCGSCQNAGHIWDAATGVQVTTPVQHHADWVNAVTFNQSGSLFACGSADKTISLWDLKSVVTAPLDPEPLQQTLSSVALSVDSTRLVAGFENGALQIWIVHDFEPIATLQGVSNSPVSAVAFFVDGKRLVAGSYDGMISVWDITGRHSVLTFHGHAERISDVAISVDAKYIASASNMDIYIWDAESGARLSHIVQGDSNTIRGLNFSPEGTKLVSWGSFHIRMSEVPMGHEIEQQSMTSNMHISSFVFSATGIQRRDREKKLEPGQWLICDPMYILNGGYNRGHIFHAHSTGKRAVALIPPRINDFCIYFSGSAAAVAFGKARDLAVMQFPPSVLARWTS